jgi:hypothetical protein
MVMVWPAAPKLRPAFIATGAPLKPCLGRTSGCGEGGAKEHEPAQTLTLSAQGMKLTPKIGAVVGLRGARAFWLNKRARTAGAATPPTRIDPKDLKKLNDSINGQFP